MASPGRRSIGVSSTSWKSNTVVVPVPSPASVKALLLRPKDTNLIPRGNSWPRGQEQVGGGSSSRSINRDRRCFETIAFSHPTTSHVTDFPIHLPRLHCALAGTPIFLGGNRSRSPASRFELKAPLKDEKPFLYLHLPNIKFYRRNEIMRLGKSGVTSFGIAKWSGNWNK